LVFVAAGLVRSKRLNNARTALWSCLSSAIASISATFPTMGSAFAYRRTRYERNAGGPAKKAFTFSTTALAVPLATERALTSPANRAASSRSPRKSAAVVDCLQPYYFHIHLVGSSGSLLDNRIYSEKMKGMTKERWSVLETSLIDSGDVSDHPYQPQFQAFVDSLQKNETMPRTDFETAFESHRVAFAADRSSAEGRPVKMSELV
jgi:hypothetical protein